MRHREEKPRWGAGSGKVMQKGPAVPWHLSNWSLCLVPATQEVGGRKVGLVPGGRDVTALGGLELQDLRMQFT